MISFGLACGHTGSSNTREYAPQAVGSNRWCDGCRRYVEVTSLYDSSGRAVKALPYPSRDNYNG